MKKTSFLQKIRNFVSAMGLGIRIDPPKPRIKKTHMASAPQTKKGKNNLSKVNRTSHK